MRRGLLLGAVLALTAGGTAQARPWLAIHAARTAIARDTLRYQDGGPYTLGACHRVAANAVTCSVHEDNFQSTVEGTACPCSLNYSATAIRHGRRISVDTPFV